jgi:hypothetical protein
MTSVNTSQRSDISAGNKNKRSASVNKFERKYSASSLSKYGSVTGIGPESEMDIII